MMSFQWCTYPGNTCTPWERMAVPLAIYLWQLFYYSARISSNSASIILTNVPVEYHGILSPMSLGIAMILDHDTSI